jgi:hypothetical protein
MLRIIFKDCSPGGPVRQPYARVDYIPKSVTKNLASEVIEFSADNNRKRKTKCFTGCRGKLILRNKLNRLQRK